MTVAARSRGAQRPRGVVHEIAARRAADLARELEAIGPRIAPPQRDLLPTLARPGLHLIAEVKRRSPSAGALGIADDVAARARAYEAGGAAAISVLCEPHWFGGSLDDLRTVRAAVGLLINITRDIGN